MNPALRHYLTGNMARIDVIVVLKEIQRSFNGTVPSENKLIRHMNRVFGWCSRRTRNKLEKLVELGVLTCRRSGVDNWTKIYSLGDL